MSTDRIQISEVGRSCCSNSVRKLDSMSSVTNKGVPSSFVAPMNCSKQGWRHLDAMFISRSNKRLLCGESINSWICFTATLQPLNFPSRTVPHPPTPRQVSVVRISSRDITQSRDTFCLHSSSVCWIVDKVCSSSFTCSSLILNSPSKQAILCSASSFACFVFSSSSWRPSSSVTRSFLSSSHLLFSNWNFSSKCWCPEEAPVIYQINLKFVSHFIITTWSIGEHPLFSPLTPINY